MQILVPQTFKPITVINNTFIQVHPTPTNGSVQESLHTGPGIGQPFYILAETAHLRQASTVMAHH